MGRGRDPGCGRDLHVQLTCCTDLAGLEVATKVLDPAVSLSGGATREAAAPARPRYLLEMGTQGCG